MVQTTLKHSPAIGEFAVHECERLRAENARLRKALNYLIAKVEDGEDAGAALVMAREAVTP